MGSERELKSQGQEVPECDLADEIGKLLRLRPDLELVIYDNDGVNFGVRLLDQSAEGPAKCIRRRISFDLPFVIRSFVESIPGETQCSSDSQSGTPANGTAQTPSVSPSGSESPPPSGASSPSSNPPSWVTAEILAACKPGEVLRRTWHTPDQVRAYPSRQTWECGEHKGLTQLPESFHDSRDESYTVPPPACKCDGSGRRFDYERPDADHHGRVSCPGCPACKPAKHDDAAFREKVGLLCGRVLSVTPVGTPTYILAREVIAMLDKETRT